MGKEQLIKSAYELWKLAPQNSRVSFTLYFQNYCKLKGKTEYIKYEPDIEEIVHKEVCKQLSTAKKNKKHYTENSLNKEQNRKFFAVMRQIALDRDQNKCVDCGSKNNLEIHHIIERKDGGTDDISNLITLCALCHTARHKGQPVYNIMIRRVNKLTVNNGIFMQKGW